MNNTSCIVEGKASKLSRTPQIISGNIMGLSSMKIV